MTNSLPTNLFTDSQTISDRSFSWALAPQREIVFDSDFNVPPIDAITLYIGPEGEANLDSTMWLWKETDPLNSYYETKFSADNGFIKGLRKVIGVPIGGTILVPWYELTQTNTLKEIKFPDDTPEGFVPANGYKYTIDGIDYKVPNLVSRTTGGGKEQGPPVTEYLAPPGCTYMVRLPGEVQGAARFTGVFGDTEVGADISGKLKVWGNPANPFGTTLQDFF